MTYSDLVDETMLMVQDSSKYEFVRSYVNMALTEATTKVALPEFKQAASITTVTDAPYVSLQVLPDRFIGGVIKLFGAGLENVKIYQSLNDMIDGEEIVDMAEVGTELKALAVEGSNVWYYPVPEVPIALLILYYTTHPLLVADTDSITLFPDFIQRKVVCARAAELCFEKIEDGIDGAKVNTESYAVTANKGIQELHEYVGRSRRHFVSSVWGV